MIKRDMKVRNLAIAVALSGIFLTSCGTTGGTTVRGDETGSEDFIFPEIQQADPIPEPEQQPIITAKKDKSVAVQNSVAEVLKNKGVATTGKNNSNTADNSLEGNWVIIKAGEYKIEQDEDMPYLIFESSKGKFYANNGCNIINGKYTVGADKTVRFADVLTTMMLCADVGYQNEISAVLSDGVSVKTAIVQKNNESYLTLSRDGQEVMQLRRNNLEAMSGQWEVVDIEGEAIDGDEVNVFFDIPELTIHGNTGCNFFNGVIVVDPTVPSSLQFAQMGVTQKLCPNAEVERMMLVALEQANTYTFEGNDTLHLKDASGHTVITLKRSYD